MVVKGAVRTMTQPVVRPMDHTRMLPVAPSAVGTHSAPPVLTVFSISAISTDADHAVQPIHSTPVTAPRVDHSSMIMGVENVVHRTLRAYVSRNRNMSTFAPIVAATNIL